MVFSYSCFINYRSKTLTEQVVDKFAEALQNELDLLADDHKTYVDRTDIDSGQMVDPSLAKALCRSAGMIVIYTPNYFNEENLYCTRELSAMERLEAKRLARREEHGLIIPVLLRGGCSAVSEREESNGLQELSSRRNVIADQTAGPKKLSKLPSTYTPVERTSKELRMNAAISIFRAKKMPLVGFAGKSHPVPLNPDPPANLFPDSVQDRRRSLQVRKRRPPWEP